MADSPREGMVPWRWGSPDVRYPERGRNQVLGYLSGRFGPAPIADTTSRTHVPPLPASRLLEEDLRILTRIVSQDRIRTDGISRLTSSVGSSYLDLVRLRRSTVPDLADAIVEPSSSSEVEAILRWADHEGIAVVPRSGGTSVVGGVDPLRNGHRAAIVVSDRRLERPREVSLDRRMASFEPGILGPDLEKHLRQFGLTLGHFPQSFERSTLAGWIAARSFGQASTRYQTPVEQLEGFTIVTPRGTFRWDRSAQPPEEPDPGSVVPGSEGILGVLVDVTIRVAPLAQRTRWHAALFPAWSFGVEAIRRLVSARPLPAVVRLSDGAETDLTFAESGWEVGGRREWVRRLAARVLGFRGEGPRKVCLLIASYEGSASDVKLGQRVLRALRRELSATALPSMIGRAWERSRFRTPYLRDDLIERGWFVETFETFVSWPILDPVEFAARDSIRRWATQRGVRAYVGAHLSHPTAEGTSLYFTVIAPQKRGEEEEAWTAFKHLTAEAVVSAGGTVSHHHGIGSYHRSWASRSIPAGRLEGLRRLKARWDPNGIMNPGKTLPEE